MLGYMGEVASQVFVMFLLILTGYVLGKTGAVKQKENAGMVTVLLYIVMPVIVIDAMLNVEYTTRNMWDLVAVMLLSLATQIFALVVTVPMFRKAQTDSRVVLRAAAIQSNAGFMAIPLASALMGERGVFLVAGYNIIFILFNWTVVYRMFNSEAKSDIKKLIFNPGLIGFVVGLFFFISGVKPPVEVASAIGYIASMNTPLAMIVTGVMIAIGGILPKKEEIKSVALSISLRLILVPAVALAAMMLLGFENEFIFISMIPVCAPVAANVGIFASRFGRDAALGSKLLALSTLLSIITMPAVLAFTKWVTTFFLN